MLGCDGLFEGGNSCQDVVDAMLELEKKYPNHSSEDLMRNLARAAILDAHYALGLFRVEGSDDNVSAMIYEPSYEEE